MPIEADDVDEDFLSQIEAAEFEALDQKRRRLSNNGGGSGGGGGGETTPQQQQSLTNSTTSSSEGSYTAALKGSRSLVWQHALSTSNRSSVVVVTDSGTGSGDACFKCGKLGHWSRDCVNTGGGGGGGLGFGGNENVEEKACKCGLGVCLVLTANTEKNRGRKFYRCPAREENGGCGFFEWCDNSSATTVSNASQSATPKSSFPDVPCPCGAGLCLVLTAKTEKNMGQQFYRCPASQENACGFFKWCIERNSTASPQANTPKIFSNTNNSNNKGYGESRGSSCFKCGQDGHWARDCTGATSATSSVGGKSASSGECYKCGMSGHWSRDCQKLSSGSSAGVAGKSASSATCYKCYKSGHWAKDCPGQAQNVGRWP